MQTFSRPVASPQTGPHHKLDALVRKHAAHPFRKPPAQYSREAFAEFLMAWDGRRAPILDAGCGTGESTCLLALRHPDRLVVGVDQSAHRLARGTCMANRPANALLLRADVVDFWLLLAQADVRLHAHKLYYPNPWPKPDQVMRRWPAHPGFPRILALGGDIECRSNWRIYVEEFAQATTLLTGLPVTVEAFVPELPVTPFERKYANSGHPLFRAVALLMPAPGTPIPAMP